jgi:hypothetical protein
MTVNHYVLPQDGDEQAEMASKQECKNENGINHRKKYVLETKIHIINITGDNQARDCAAEVNNVINKTIKDMVNASDQCGCHRHQLKCCLFSPKLLLLG